MFIIFFICALAETNRHPFDLPEAEAELVSGYNVEYSAMSFALFFLAEYSNIILMCSMTVILFLGGFFFSNILVYYSYITRNYFLINKQLSSKLMLYSNRNTHPFSKKYYEEYRRRLNSKNITIQTDSILNEENEYYYYYKNNSSPNQPKYRIIINNNDLSGLGFQISNEDEFESDFNQVHSRQNPYKVYASKENLKSKNFEVIKNYPIKLVSIDLTKN
jgi:hypothetical protein